MASTSKVGAKDLKAQRIPGFTEQKGFGLYFHQPLLSAV